MMTIAMTMPMHSGSYDSMSWSTSQWHTCASSQVGDWKFELQKLRNMVTHWELDLCTTSISEAAFWLGHDSTSQHSELGSESIR